ncbi:MAG TPA: DUF3011 domain-containing protein [Terriglobales bacterium]|nr:DUF3011 domain-containing protein [Terriglobales bacterium]
MSRRIVLISLGLLLLLLSGSSFAQTAITCSSDNMRRNYCDIGQNGGVRLLRQRSDAQCQQGSTWGWNDSQIWVDRGCRADFEVLPWVPPVAGSITCSSDNMRRNYCDIGQNGGARLLRQRSDASCIEGSTWGVNGNQLWVDRGCRADFQVLTYRGGDWNDNPNAGGARTVTCSSDDMRRNYCDVGPNGGIRLLRQRSDARCSEGSTWGSRGNQVWVDRGCRADFTVLPVGDGWNRGGRDRDRDHDWDRGGSGVTTVYCASDDMRRNYCSVGKNRGIRLVRQRSDARCDLNRSYGFDHDRIWVDRGCRADFEVQTRR